MKSNLDVIKSGFAFMDNSHAQQIEQEGYFSYWIFRWDDRFGVGIEVPRSLKFSEVFATARLFTDTIYIKSEGADKNFLLLTSSDEYSRNEFAKVCESFIDLGSDAEQRYNLMRNPSIWWKTWRTLLGNAIREKKPYDLIGELIIYMNFLRYNQKDIIWNGPKKSSHDLEGQFADYEIKSTIKRYDSTITITGQHQLTAFPNKKLFLVLCRFESSDKEGISINSIVEELLTLGINKEEIEKKLSALGFEEGRTSRSDSYILLGSPQVFLVDSNFPRITEASFVGGVIPQGITRITYEVELLNLPSLSLDAYFKQFVNR